MSDMVQLVSAVKSHALENYNKGGWDFCVECWSDSEIADMIKQESATTPEAAIKAVGRVCSLLAERRDEALAEIL